jgi:uncharacterized repeat protein (TIGR03843 family)
MVLSTQDVLQILTEGKLALQGEFLWGSNHTFLVQVEHEKGGLAGVYKPTRGERPLWDFPYASLARREVAAFLVSEALGWHFVPPTILRRRAPFGIGSLQQFIDYDVNHHYFNFTEPERQRLRPVAVFDLLVNNADRKGSHVAMDENQKIWLIDHGVCFHVEDKLRTVIWDFAEEQIPDEICLRINGLIEQLQLDVKNLDSLNARLRKYISAGEVKALLHRAKDLVQNPHFPAPDPSRRQFPWPQL